MDARRRRGNAIGLYREVPVAEQLYCGSNEVVCIAVRRRVLPCDADAIRRRMLHRNGRKARNDCAARANVGQHLIRHPPRPHVALREHLHERKTIRAIREYKAVREIKPERVHPRAPRVYLGDLVQRSRKGASACCTQRHSNTTNRNKVFPRIGKACVAAHRSHSRRFVGRRVLLRDHCRNRDEEHHRHRGGRRGAPELSEDDRRKPQRKSHAVQNDDPGSKCHPIHAVTSRRA